MKDLLAVATVRRLLLSMGYSVAPEGAASLVGPIGLWVAEPRAGLDGLTPQEALAQPDGEVRLRACLSAMLAKHERTTGDADRPIGEHQHQALTTEPSPSGHGADSTGDAPTPAPNAMG